MLPGRRRTRTAHGRPGASGPRSALSAWFQAGGHAVVVVAADGRGGPGAVLAEHLADVDNRSVVGPRPRPATRWPERTGLCSWDRQVRQDPTASVTQMSGQIRKHLEQKSRAQKARSPVPRTASAMDRQCPASGGASDGLDHHRWSGSLRRRSRQRRRPFREQRVTSLWSGSRQFSRHSQACARR